jgi:hypothetical protein
MAIGVDEYFNVHFQGIYRARVVIIPRDSIGRVQAQFHMFTWHMLLLTLFTFTFIIIVIKGVGYMISHFVGNPQGPSPSFFFS